MKFSFFSQPSLPKMVVSATTRKDFHEALAACVPAAAVTYAVALWETEPFSFKISRTRSSCLGNYSYRNGRHLITINNDLNVYQFLITYVHEVAHQRVFIASFKNKRKKTLPHGTEWQQEFQKLMQPILNETVFPADVLSLLRLHLLSPPASTVRDAKLMAVLRSYSAVTNNSTLCLLETLQEGDFFVFKKRIFQKISTKRTRVLCQDKESGLRYLISGQADFERVFVEN